MPTMQRWVGWGTAIGNAAVWLDPVTQYVRHITKLSVGILPLETVDIAAHTYTFYYSALTLLGCQVF
jgi:hypothetical protein